MSEFSLRTLHREVWDELGRCDRATLAAEIARRVPAHHRLDALEEALATYTSLFIRGQRRGDARKASIRDRLERRTERIGDCLIWTGRVSVNGYGKITMSDHGDRKYRPVHCVSYEEFVGPIPEGYEVDHECHSRDPDACPRPCIHILCWNPEHLRAVTPAVNCQRRRTRPLDTHCRNGHEHTPENTYIPPGKPWVRVCIPCRRDRDRARYRERAALAAA
jgi:hypothetical protein